MYGSENVEQSNNQGKESTLPFAQIQPQRNQNQGPSIVNFTGPELIDINGNIENWSAKFDHGSGKTKTSNNGNKIFPSDIGIIQSKNGFQYEASTIPSKWNKTTPKSPKKFIIMPSSLSKIFDNDDENSNVSHNGTTITIMNEYEPVAKSIMHNSDGAR